MESMNKHAFRALVIDALEDADLKPEDVGLTVDDEGRIVLVLDGLTLDGHEHVVKAEREFSVEVLMNLTVTVTVTAASEDDARERVESEMAWADVQVDTGTLDLTDVDYNVEGIGDVEQQ
jgi:hypothetical protein